MENPKFLALLDKIADLHNRKNANYARVDDPLHNLKECQDLGVSPFLGVMIRLTDKFSRAKNLTRGVPDLVGESLKNTLMDISIYALLAILLLEEEEPPEYVSLAPRCYR